MAVHDRQPDDQVADAKRTKRHDGALQGNDWAGAPEGGSVCEIKHTPGNRWVGLDELSQIVNPEIVLLQQADDRQGDATGRR